MHGYIEEGIALIIEQVIGAGEARCEDKLVKNMLVK